MSQAFPFLLPFQLDSIGAPLSAGELTTLDILTSDPKVTYRDSAGTIPNPNPIILDAAGRFRCYLAPGGYKFFLRDSMGNLIWSEEYTSAAGSSYEIFGTIAELRDAQKGTVPYAFVMGYYTAGDIGVRVYRLDVSSSAPDDGGGVIGSGTGRWILEWDGKPVDVRWFGAKGDGVANDAAAVLAAQTWALAKNLKTGIVFTHVPVFYNLGTDAMVISADAYATPGGQMRPPASGMSFTGSFAAGAYRVFYGAEFASNAVDFTSCRLPVGALSEWFGAKGDDSSDDYVAVKALFDSKATFMRFPSPLGYKTQGAPFSVFPTVVLIECARYVIDSDTEVVYVGAGYSTSGGVLAGLDIESLSAVRAPLGAFDLGQFGDIDVQNDMGVGRDLSVGRDITGARDLIITRNIYSGPIQAKPGTGTDRYSVGGCVAKSVTASSYVQPGVYVLKSYTLPAGSVASVGDELLVEASGTVAANANAKTVYIQFSPSGTTAAEVTQVPVTGGRWRMRARVVVRSGTVFLVNGDSQVYDQSTFRALIFLNSLNTATAALSDLSLTPIPNPTQVSNGTVAVTMGSTRVDNGLFGDQDLVTVGDVFSQVLTFSVRGTGVFDADVVCDFMKVSIQPAPSQMF